MSLHAALQSRSLNTVQTLWNWHESKLTRITVWLDCQSKYYQVVCHFFKDNAINFVMCNWQRFKIMFKLNARYPGKLCNHSPGSKLNGPGISLLNRVAHYEFTLFEWPEKVWWNNYTSHLIEIYPKYEATYKNSCRCELQKEKLKIKHVNEFYQCVIWTTYFK